MRRIRQVEVVLGTGLLLGPLVYAVTLHFDKPKVEVVEVEVEVVKVVEVAAPVIEPTPTPKVEAEPTPVAKPAPNFEPRPFMFVAGNTVILDTQASADWARGELFEPAGDANHRAARAVDLERVPADLATRIAQPIDLYGAEGKLCTATIERLTMVAQFDGWSLVGVYGEVEQGDDGLPVGATQAEVRTKVWDSQPKWLIGELASDPSCAGASWARDVALPAPTILTESEGSNATGRARVRAYRSSSELAALKTEHEAFRADLDPESLAEVDDWDTVVAKDPARASVWLDGAGETHVVELRFGPEPTGGCGDYDVYRTRLEVRHGARFEPSEWSVDPIAVFDADLDGQFELLYDLGDQGWTRTLHSKSPALEREIQVDADWMCPC